MSELVFVTGASGFLGSNIVDQLLSNGYRVRATARAPKVSALRANYAKHGNKFEAVVVNDIIQDQFPEALQGVDAVIHTASPIPEKSETAEQIFEIAIEGTLNVVRQAERAGIKRVVVTSSVASVANPQGSFTDKDWNPITREQALKGSLMDAYRGSKTFAEQALWEFADAHPNLDITTINPPFFYGAFGKGFSLPEPNYYLLSTNLYIYRLLTPDGPWPAAPRYIDVRDAAKAHVFALKSPLSAESDVGRKRLIISAIDSFEYKGLLDLVKAKRPELADRLTKVAPPTASSKNVPFDVERIEKVLGLKRGDFIKFEDTVIDAVDGLIALEKDWVAKGNVINVPKL